MWRYAHAMAHMQWSEDTIRTWFSSSALLRQGSSCFYCDVCSRLVSPQSSREFCLCFPSCFGSTDLRDMHHQTQLSSRHFRKGLYSSTNLKVLSYQVLCCPGQIMGVRPQTSSYVHMVSNNLTLTVQKNCASNQKCSCFMGPIPYQLLSDQQWLSSALRT